MGEESLFEIFMRERVENVQEAVLLFGIIGLLSEFEAWLIDKDKILKEPVISKTTQDEGVTSTDLLSAVSDRVRFLGKKASNDPGGDEGYCLGRLHEAQAIMDLINNKIKWVENMYIN